MDRVEAMGDVRSWADEKGVRLIGTFLLVSVASAPMSGGTRALRPDLVGRRAAGTLFTGGEFLRRWTEWGIPLYDWPMHRAQNYACGGSVSRRPLDFSWLPHRSCARTFPDLQLPLDAAAGRRVCPSEPGGGEVEGRRPRASFCPAPGHNGGRRRTELRRG